MAAFKTEFKRTQIQCTKFQQSAEDNTLNQVSNQCTETGVPETSPSEMTVKAKHTGIPCTKVQQSANKQCHECTETDGPWARLVPNVY